MKEKFLQNFLRLDLLIEAVSNFLVPTPKEGLTENMKDSRPIRLERDSNKLMQKNFNRLKKIIGDTNSGSRNNVCEGGQR